MKARIAALFVLLLGTAHALSATVQAPDLLILGDKTHPLQANPLAPYLSAHPGALPAPEVISSANWRGYLATWALRDGSLVLVDVTVATKAAMDPKAPKEAQRRSVLEDLFPGSGPHEATWFTGHLIVPTGDGIPNVHLGYASRSSSYRVVTIVAGRVVKAVDVTGEGLERFRREQFAAFKKTAEYAQAAAKARHDKPSRSVAEVEEYLLHSQSSVYLQRVFPNDLDGSGK